MRAFFAVNLDAEVLAEIDAIQNSFKHIEGIRWVAPAKMHITLQFLGEITRQRAEEIAAILSGPAHELPPFALSFRGTGVFPHPKDPRVLWLGIDEGRKELQRLYGLLRDLLPPAGKEASFRPHVTLGRRRKNTRLTLPAEILSREVACRNRQYVDRFALMRSHLYATGPVYETVETFFLKK